MILDRLDPLADELARGTGWHVKAEGACRGELCVPLRRGTLRADGRVEAPALADALGMALVAERPRLALVRPQCSVGPCQGSVLGLQPVRLAEDGDWLSDVRRVGAENYYPKLEI
jgi:hypothetical protein